MASYIGDRKYVGTEKIVIGVDIGTTHSEFVAVYGVCSYLFLLGAVSFAYLYPGDYTRIRMVGTSAFTCLSRRLKSLVYVQVNRWPGQPESTGSSKVGSSLR